MLVRVLVFLLETIFSLLMGAALVRAWMNWHRVSMTVQPGRFVMALTDWLVKPLRRALPKALAQARVDWASIFAALVLALLYALVWSLIFGVMLGVVHWGPGVSPTAFLILLGFAVKMLAKVALQTAMIIVLGYVILSWVQPGSPVYVMLARLSDPLLSPLRRVLPVLGGVDLSPLVLLLMLQVGLMVIS
ncbi:MAG: YggT family protein [Comamonadaceae bacterium]|nr:MAG: YggT family protein [Comamonadaceae bacterium]